MDKSRLAIVVYKRTGFPLEPDDPAFVLVELNRVALEELLDEATRRIAERLEPFPDQIRSSGAAVAAHVASQSAGRVAEMLAESRRTLAADGEQAQRRITEHVAKLSESLVREVAAAVRAAEIISRGGAMRAQWVLAAAVIGILLLTVGFVGGLAAGSPVCLRIFGGG